MSEMDKLAIGLEEKGIGFERIDLFDGEQILVPTSDGEDVEWDAVCHKYSYGGPDGLLEIMGSIVSENAGDTVEGYLTAEDILKRL